MRTILQIIQILCLILFIIFDLIMIWIFLEQINGY